MILIPLIDELAGVAHRDCALARPAGAISVIDEQTGQQVYR